MDSASIVASINIIQARARSKYIANPMSGQSEAWFADAAACQQAARPPSITKETVDGPAHSNNLFRTRAQR